MNSNNNSIFSMLSEIMAQNFDENINTSIRENLTSNIRNLNTNSFTFDIQSPTLQNSSISNLNNHSTNSNLNNNNNQDNSHLPNNTNSIPITPINSNSYLHRNLNTSNTISSLVNNVLRNINNLPVRNLNNLDRNNPSSGIYFSFNTELNPLHTTNDNESNDGISFNTYMNLKKIKYSEHKQKKYNLCESCSICLCDFKEKDNCIVLPCGHCYHKSCIKKWICKKQTCPSCRKKIKVEEENNSNNNNQSTTPNST